MNYFFRNRPALREALPFFIPVLLLVPLAGCWFGWVWALVPALLAGYILYFFRDPVRIPPVDPNLAVSAADGRVLSVEEMEESIFTNRRMKRVAVFLSVLDVHVNRVPCAGKVAATRYKKGEFLDARNPEIDLRNEALTWHFETEHGPVIVRQIAGLIARRIVPWKLEGAVLDRGERFGMIRFGSRTDVYFPVEAEILVRPGDRVQGGSTPIARMRSTKEST